jgi:hypothetical protein
MREPLARRTEPRMSRCALIRATGTLTTSADAAHGSVQFSLPGLFVPEVFPQRWIGGVRGGGTCDRLTLERSGGEAGGGLLGGRSHGDTSVRPCVACARHFCPVRLEHTGLRKDPRIRSAGRVRNVNRRLRAARHCPQAGQEQQPSRPVLDTHAGRSKEMRAAISSRILVAVYAFRPPRSVSFRQHSEEMIHPAAAPHFRAHAARRRNYADDAPAERQTFACYAMIFVACVTSAERADMRESPALRTKPPGVALRAHPGYVLPSWLCRLR